jgi:hypothetical protein
MGGLAILGHLTPASWQGGICKPSFGYGCRDSPLSAMSRSCFSLRSPTRGPAGLSPGSSTSSIRSDLSANSATTSFSNSRASRSLARGEVDCLPWPRVPFTLLTPTFEANLERPCTMLWHMRRKSMWTTLLRLQPVHPRRSCHDLRTAGAPSAECWPRPLIYPRFHPLPLITRCRTMASHGVSHITRAHFTVAPSYCAPSECSSRLSLLGRPSVVCRP